ncbi:5'-nucleotidase [Sandaracinus amylolyticus]|uniref:5'-nucleotidase n=1 Tax=Sandaracinus amylolyticus TaxID=927083 RepID=A0A0F6YHC0_9BACT|nr:5'-nucleotidase [Sandaracinus amylolyticus]
MCWDGEREMEWFCDAPRDGGVSSHDAGVDAAVDSFDSGPSVDAAPTLDSGVEDSGAPDSGIPTDSGAPSDSSVPVDSSTSVDSGPPDSGPPDSGPPDSGPPAEMRYCVDIDVSNTCVMSVSPREITIPAGQTAYFCWRNRSRDYEIDVWLSYGGGYTELAPGATWNEPIGHCLGPNPHDEYADIDTACSSHRFLIHCL